MVDRADKTVSISVNDQPELKMTFRHVTEVKPKEELDSENTDTFDGPVGRGTEHPGYTIDVSKLDMDRAEGGLSAMDRYALFKKILVALRNNKGTLSISEIVRPKGEGAFEVTEIYNNIGLSSNEHTLNPKDLTARDLSFTAESRTDVDPVRI